MPEHTDPRLASSAPMTTRSPLLWALLAGVAVLAAAFVPVVRQMLDPERPVAALRNELAAPWQIERSPEGELRAFGLRLPGSTLADAVHRWGDDLQVAVIASRGQGAALEAFTDRWAGAGVTGKLVLATDAQSAAVTRWQDRSPRRETLSAQAQRWHLLADDHVEALRSGVVGLTFLPASRMDAATLQARFGYPAEVVPGKGSTRHWLYPDRGLAIAWDEASGKAVLQVVVLAEFDSRLRTPVLAAAAGLEATAALPAADRPR